MDFASYAKADGVVAGLWTQQDIWPSDKNNPQKGERDIEAEAKAGVSALKTDVAWVGNGYSMALDGIKTAFEAIKEYTRPLIVSLDGWAGSQRYAGMWTGDQTDGAIIPMAVENNSPYELSGKEDRIYEVYPFGNTEFVQYDDQGDSEAYKINEYTTTKITSKAPVI